MKSLCVMVRKYVQSENFPNVGQRSQSKSRAQHLWYHRKGVVIRNTNAKYRCLWNTNAPLPQLIENRLDLRPTNLNIDRGHLLIKDYLPTKFEASGAKRSWVISCTRWRRLGMTFDLDFDLLTWLSIGIMYSSRTIYLPSLKLLGQSNLELSVAQG